MKRLAVAMLSGGLLLMGCSTDGQSTAAPTETVYVTAEPEVVTEVVTETVTAEPEVVTETVTIEAEPEVVEDDDPVALSDAQTQFGDFEAEVTYCVVDSWGDAEAGVRVTNNSGQTLDITGTVEVVDSATGVRHSTITFYEELVASGQTVDTTAVGFDGAPAAFDCNIIGVDGYDW